VEGVAAAVLPRLTE
ncbi:hypothetical protein ECPA34_3744, partial [Escherichia coli PA34]